MMVVAVKMVSTSSGLRPAVRAPSGDDLASLGHGSGVDAGHQEGAVGHLARHLHDTGAGGGDVDCRGRRFTSVLHSAVGVVAKGHHLARHQFLHHVTTESRIWRTVAGGMPMVAVEL